VPYRTGSDPDLFGDLLGENAGADMLCTFAPCYAAKLRAWRDEQARSGTALALDFMFGNQDAGGRRRKDPQVYALSTTYNDWTFEREYGSADEARRHGMDPKTSTAAGGESYRALADDETCHRLALGVFTRTTEQDSARIGQVVRICMRPRADGSDGACRHWPEGSAKRAGTEDYNLQQREKAKQVKRTRKVLRIVLDRVLAAVPVTARTSTCRGPCSTRSRTT
jgi:hypothetical protein